MSEQFAIASSIDRLTTRQSELISHVEDALDKALSAGLQQPNPPIATIGSTSQPITTHVDPQTIADNVAQTLDLGKLKVSRLDNGDISYSLPLDTVRAAAADMIGYNREAFREVGFKSGTPHIEVHGQTDRQIAAAMEFAKQRWSGDAVVIRAGDKHVGRIVEHAVRAGLAIDTSRDPHMATLVTRERERQANAVRREQAPAIPTIERVPAGPRQAR